MPDTTTVVKTNDQGATTGDEVKKVTETTVNQDASLDTVALLEKLRKTESDRDNYRAGLLALKSKKFGDEDFDMDAFIKLQVQEALADKDVNTTEAELKRALKERDEAFIALKNRSELATVPEGTSTETKTVPTDNVLSQQKIDQFKKMGKSDAWIEAYKKNVLKNRGFN